MFVRRRDRFELVCVVCLSDSSLSWSSVCSKRKPDESTIYGCLSLDEGSLASSKERVTASQVIVVRWRRNARTPNDVPPGGNGDNRHEPR